MLFSSAHIAKVLQQKGFFYVSQKGSHAKFRKVVGNKKWTVIVPAGKREVPHGTFKSMLRQAGLQEKDFNN